MKILKKILLSLMLVLPGMVMAQSGLEGTWEGTLVTGPGAEMNVQFIVSEAEDGTPSVLINSTDSGALKNIAASAVSVNGDELRFEFSSLSGEYVGTYSEGRLEGEWKQLDQSFPLTMAPYQKSKLSEEELAFIVGTWSGKLIAPGIEVPVVFHFEDDGEGGVNGKFDSPLEGAFGLPISNIELTGDELSLALEFARVALKGRVTEAGIEATWSQMGQELSLTLVKGEYEAPEVSINLDDASQERLLGSWSGQLGPLTLVFRFEKDESGEFAAFVDSPSQGVNDLLITELSLDGDSLNFKLMAPAASYSGTLQGEEIAGTWTQNGMPMPLNVKKGEPSENQAPVVELDLDEASQEKLIGTWSGEIGGLTLKFRFEKNDGGAFLAFVDSPNQGVSGLVVNEISLDGSSLAFKLTVPPASYSGELDGDQIVGNWQQNGMSNPLIVDKE